jgi:uncharacterized protein YeaO (DUF488 family)
MTVIREGKMLRIKRVYEKRNPGDGKRILVDRLWPRGLTREEAAIDEWMKDLAPSDELRRWFGHEPEKWPEFQRRYTQELLSPDKVKLVDKVVRMAMDGNVTIVYAARDTEHNNAKVLEEILQSVEVLQQ